MFFLVQIRIDKNGTVSKGTSDFEDMKSALIQFHIAMSSAMQKDEVQKFTCVILNENGLVQKVETYEVPTIVEEVEPIAE